MCAVKCAVYNCLTVLSYRPIRGTLFDRLNYKHLINYDRCTFCMPLLNILLIYTWPARIVSLKWTPSKYSNFLEKVRGDLNTNSVFSDVLIPLESSRAIERIKRNDCGQINIRSTCRLNWLPVVSNHGQLLWTLFPTRESWCLQKLNSVRVPRHFLFLVDQPQYIWPTEGLTCYQKCLALICVHYLEESTGNPAIP